jgi:glycosyltransferase involved in cell wall biosynthesis
VQALLQAADVYCQPNRDPDSFGLSFIEALGASLPVVTTRMGGASEIVNTTCGVLVEPGSIAELTAALRRLLSHPAERRRMGEAARSRAAELCNLPQSLSRLARELAGLPSAVSSLS